MNFSGDLIAKQLPDGFHWEMYESFTYHIGAIDGPEFVMIGRGFVTDFASIPRGLWNLWPPAAGKHSKAAVVHDCLYKTGYVNVTDGSIRHVNRGEADRIFKEAMEVARVNWFSRQMIYSGVRVGGRGAWNKHRNADA